MIIKAESPLVDNERLVFAHKKGSRGTGYFNCWNATLYILSKVDELYWAEHEEIEQFIYGETYEVGEAQAGDILVLFGNYYEDYDDLEDDEEPDEKILHTAVYVTKDKLFHKMGGMESEFTDIDGVMETYYNAQRIEIRRIIAP
jgi:hypothetical protein